MKYTDDTPENLFEKAINLECTDKSRPAPFPNKDNVIARKTEVI